MIRLVDYTWLLNDLNVHIQELDGHNVVRDSSRRVTDRGDLDLLAHGFALRLDPFFGLDPFFVLRTAGSVHRDSAIRNRSTRFSNLGYCASGNRSGADQFKKGVRRDPLVWGTGYMYPDPDPPTDSPHFSVLKVNRQGLSQRSYGPTE